jgi:hypothetical protein
MTLATRGVATEGVLSGVGWGEAVAADAVVADAVVASGFSVDGEQAAISATVPRTAVRERVRGGIGAPIV